ncbi:MAG: MFS transporter [Dokdonella sp.]
MQITWTRASSMADSPPLTSPKVAPAPSAGWALATLSITMLMSSLGTSIANIGLPTFVKVFGTSLQAAQWIVLAYLLAVTTLVVSVGRLGDMIGRRKLMLLGIGVFSLASATCGAANELWILIAARVVQGFGAAVMMALSMALVGEAIPKERAGRAMGLLGSMSAVGTALGPSVGGGLISAFGWPSLFFLNIPLGAAALVLAYCHLPRDRPSDAKLSFDYVGSILLAGTLAAYSIAMTLGHDVFGPTNAALLGVALAGGAAFVALESRIAAPLVRVSLFLNPTVSRGFAASTLASTVAMTTLVIGPFYLTGGLQLSPAETGLVMSVGPVVAALMGVPAGKAVDHFGARRVTVAGLALMAIGAAFLGRAQIAFGIAGYMIPLVILTAGFATFQASNNTGVVTGVEPAQRGVVSGLLNLSRNLGLITGASLMGAVFSLESGARDIALADIHSVVSGMHAAFTVATALILCALIVVMVPACRTTTDLDSSSDSAGSASTGP